MRGSEFLIVVCHGSHCHRQLVAVGADRFQVMLVSQVCIGGSGKSCAEGIAHGVYYVFVPQKAVAPPGAKVAHAQFGNSAQPLHLLPKPGLGASVENIELQFAQHFQAGAGLQFPDL